MDIQGVDEHVPVRYRGEGEAGPGVPTEVQDEADDVVLAAQAGYVQDGVPRGRVLQAQITTMLEQHSNNQKSGEIYNGDDDDDGMTMMMMMMMLLLIIIMILMMMA